MVGFEGKELHDRLFYGLEGLFSSWTAFQMAIQGEWGGSETAQKREWFIESMADYLYDEGDKIDEFDVADVLLQIMGDEFEVLLEDGSETQIAKNMLRLYHDLNDEGNEGYYLQLRQLKANESVNSTLAKCVSGKPSQTGSGGDDSDSDSWSSDCEDIVESAGI